MTAAQLATLNAIMDDDSNPFGRVCRAVVERVELLPVGTDPLLAEEVWIALVSLVEAPTPASLAALNAAIDVAFAVHLD